MLAQMIAHMDIPDPAKQMISIGFRAIEDDINN